LTGSRLRAGFATFFALVPLLAVAPTAHAQTACPEPDFLKTVSHATAKQLVLVELTGVTPGSEYLFRVGGRELKSGVAETDRVTRRMRMPNLGDKRRDARIVVVIANDACENSPWKLKQKLGYRPPEVPEAPPKPEVTTPPQAPNPTPTPTPDVGAQSQPNPTPSTSPTPTPTPKATPTPSLPKQPTAITPSEPPAGARAWLTPLDTFSRGSDEAPQPSAAALPRLDRKTDDANSNAALLGLGGLFILIGGISAIAWTRFRRYDDERLAELLNPDGKLPKMLDDKAVDLGLTEGTVATNAEAAAAAANPSMKIMTPQEAAAEMEAASPATSKPAAKPVQLGSLVLPPAAAGPAAPNGAPVLPPAGADQPDVPPATTDPPAPAGAPAPSVTPVNGTPPAVNGTPANGAPSPKDSYRQEVESELQRILGEAGLDAELEGILSDARAEAARQGVPIDSDLMLRALCDETNGSAKLSDTAKGELKQRFQRIAAEERGQIPPTGQ
jgi:hypothetical protein